jgi:hypothetical protein
VQERLDRVHVRLVPAPGYGPAIAQALADGLRARLGDVDVSFENVDEIPRGSNGKFKSMVCRLPATERAIDRDGGRALRSA